MEGPHTITTIKSSSVLRGFPPNLDDWMYFSLVLHCLGVSPLRSTSWPGDGVLHWQGVLLTGCRSGPGHGLSGRKSGTHRQWIPNPRQILSLHIFPFSPPALFIFSHVLHLCLQHGSNLIGMTDLNVPEQLYQYMVGGHRRAQAGASRERHKSPSYQIKVGIKEEKAFF